LQAFSEDVGRHLRGETHPSASGEQSFPFRLALLKRLSAVVLLVQVRAGRTEKPRRHPIVTTDAFTVYRKRVERSFDTRKLRGSVETAPRKDPRPLSTDDQADAACLDTPFEDLESET
jgi:hypothetical protein